MKGMKEDMDPGPPTLPPPMKEGVGPWNSVKVAEFLGTEKRSPRG